MGGHGLAPVAALLMVVIYWGRMANLTLTDPHFAFQNVNLWEEFGPWRFPPVFAPRGCITLGHACRHERISPVAGD